MKILVFDSTPLIYLGKVKVLEKLEYLKTKNIIPSKVYKEVIEGGKKFGFVETIYIEKLVKNKIFEIKEFKNIDKLESNYPLSEADIEVLSAAKQLRGIAVMDEVAAREIASIENIETGGSIFILFSLLRRGKMNKKEFKNILDEMINLGWRCSTELYLTILNELNKL